MSCVKVTSVVLVNDPTPWQVTGLLKPQNEHKANYCIPVFTYCICQWVLTLAFVSLSYYNWGICLVKSLVVYFPFVAAKRASHFLSLQGFWLFNFNTFPASNSRAAETGNPLVATPREMASWGYPKRSRARSAPLPLAGRHGHNLEKKSEWIGFRGKNKAKISQIICELKIDNSIGCTE